MEIWMSEDLTKKHEQFNEFFSIEHNFNINIGHDINCPPDNYQDFLDKMPLPFKVASEVVSIDQSSFRSIQDLGSGASQLIEYLNHQSQKIDLLLGYIINQQDEKSLRHQGKNIGGGGIIFHSENSYNVNDKLEAKLFLNQGNSAVYCYLEVIELNALEGINEYKVIYHTIRDEDREMMVRTSLQIQSKQLQALAQKRNSQK